MTSEGIRARILVVFAAVALFGLPLLATIAQVATDYLWFIDLGQREVFVTRIASQALTGAAFALVTFVLLYVNMAVARRMAPRAVLTSVGDLPPRFEEIISQIRTRSSTFVDRLILWGSVTGSVLVGIAMSGQWVTLRLALTGTVFGETDAQFGRDIGFYVFTLPALRMVADWLTPILLLVLVLTLLVHLVDGAIQPVARLQGVAPHVKAHVSVLLGFIVASRAFDYYLRIYELNFSPRGQVNGASYTDVNAQLPALQVLIVIALLSATALLVNIRFQGWRLPIAALGLWVAASILVGSAYPAIIQQFRVRPNEIAAEQPYIERNIAATRKAFGLDQVETRQFPAAETLTPQDVVNNAGTLENIRLWDPSIVAQSYSQLQVIRPYYDFADVDIDRYMIDGTRQQVLVSAREMDTSQLDPQAQTWVNTHLVYTHGYGMVMSPVNAADTRGFPRFLIGDIPPRSTIDLEVEQPAIYFGERTTDYVIVNTGIEEFDYPVGDENAESSYDGASGIKVGSLLRRAAFALRFGASQILFSQYIDADSRVLFARDIQTRIERVAPWLWLEDDPYPVITPDGRVTWVVDGYTWSNHYPYSQPYQGVNYLRNSVKVTVDAYDGTTTLYAFDESDPVLQAWRDVFPGLVKDGSELPDEIRAHLRYPQGLFSIQAEVYKRYHMTNPRVFYNKEDLWQLPGETDGTPMEPFYVLMRLPGETAEDFHMIIPFTASKRPNMIGWMSAKSDPADYGKRVVYQFPKERVILGPDQVLARINQDETISPQLTLWSQRGSQVIFGNMLVVPLEESIVYIQPLYLQAEQGAIPELTRVLVVYADKVEMAPDLEQALLKVFGAGEAPVAPGDDDPPVSDGTAAEARSLYEQAIEAQKAGDWAEYGRLIRELGRVLDQIAGPAEPETATP